jgi:ferredoxin--NADP+ reductase
MVYYVLLNGINQDIIFNMKYRVAIVGAGPAGHFTAQALQKAQTEELTFLIDVIERLPTPWGLVRSGVAPDHPKIKTVSKVFESTFPDNFTLGSCLLY